MMIERIVLLLMMALLSIRLDWAEVMPLMTSVCTVVGAVIGCIGMGRWVVKEARWDLAFCIGVGTMGTVSLPLAYCGWMFLLPVLFLIGWWRFYQYHDQLQLPQFSQGHWVIISGLVLLILWNSTLPIVDTDALYYHLALPKHFWLESRLLAGELNPNASRPLLIHLVYTAIYGCSNLSTVVLFASICALGAWVSIVQTLQEQGSSLSWVVWMIVLGSYSLLEQLTAVNNNMMVMWWCVLAYRHRQDHRLGILGVLVGFAIAGKFTAAVVAGLIGLTSGTRNFWKEVAIATCVIAIWPLRNVVDGLHPFFPYMGWSIDIPFMYVDKYGMGRDVLSMLLLPWNVLEHAKIQSVQFMGQLSPVFWVVILAWFYQYWDVRVHWRKWLVIGGGCFFWAMGPHWIRHLIPLLGVFVMLSLLSTWRHLRLIQILAVTALGLGLSSNVAPFLQHTYERWQHEVSIPGEKATAWLNEHVNNEPVALMFLWTGAHLNSPYVLSSVEDHTPVRHWVLQYGDSSMQELRAQGIRWIAVGPHSFHRSAYLFLSDDEFDVQWKAPMASLEAMLNHEGRWITKQDGVDIYYLP